MLDISARYPLQVDTSDPAGYPRGKARNVGTLGDGSGTPFEKDLLNDIFGLQQALLAIAGITPSGVPDKVGASDQLTAIQYIAETSRCEFNVKKLGLKGDNVTDDTAQLAVICALLVAAFGGGTLFFPPGSYRFTNKFVLPPNISVRGIPGLSIWKIDHASNRILSVELGTWTEEAEIYGIRFEAAQANSGAAIYVDGACQAKLRFKKCSANIGALLLQGELLNHQTDSQTVFEDCRMVSAKIAASATFTFGGSFKLVRGEYTMAPAATYAMFEQLNAAVNELDIAGTRFKRVSTALVTVGFVRLQGGSMIARGTRFAVDDAGAGVGTYAFEWGGGSAPRVMVDDSNDFTTVNPYKTVQVAAAGSRLAMNPKVRIDAGVADVVINDGYEIVEVKCSKTTTPQVTMPALISPSQKVKVVIRNASASDWTGTMTFVNFSLAVGVNYAWITVPAGRYFSFNIVASDIVAANTYEWFMEAAA